MNKSEFYELYPDVLLAQDVIEVTWAHPNRDNLIENGYRFTKYGDRVLIKPWHLARNSHERVLIRCPECNKERTRRWKEVLDAGRTCCRGCTKHRNHKKRKGHKRLTDRKGFIDLTGMRFGRLVVLELDREKTDAMTGTHAYWLCLCDCGNYSSPNTQRLREGKTVSCGCYHKELVKNRSGAGANNWKGGPVAKSCEECGKDFFRPPSRVEFARFCSRKCHGIWQSRTNVGENNPSWNPKLTNEARLLGRKIPGYKSWRTAVYERDGYACQVCSMEKKERLNAHHLYDYSTYPELKLVVENGITMHESCHMEFHKWMGGRHISCTPEDLERWTNSK